MSALGIAYVDESDVPVLHLDAIKGAKSVLQLAAAEEYRVCFSLTNVDSAKKRGVGREVFLPGAHSDVGGGYVNNDSESKTVFVGSATSSIVEYLRQNGWHSDRELDHVVIDSVESSHRFEEFRVARKDISNQYSFIPLRLMADYATEEGLSVLPKLKAVFNPSLIPRELKNQIEQYAKGNDSKASDWQRNEPSLNALRHDFLHFSSRSELGFHLRTLDIGNGRKRPFRRVYNG